MNRSQFHWWFTRISTIIIIYEVVDFIYLAATCCGTEGPSGYGE